VRRREYLGKLLAQQANSPPSSFEIRAGASLLLSLCRFAEGTGIAGAAEGSGGVSQCAVAEERKATAWRQSLSLLRTESIVGPHDCS
jgi:hypothetical protein